MYREEERFSYRGYIVRFPPFGYARTLRSFDKHQTVSAAPTASSRLSRGEGRREGRLHSTWSDVTKRARQRQGARRDVDDTTCDKKNRGQFDTATTMSAGIKMNERFGPRGGEGVAGQRSAEIYGRFHTRIHTYTCAREKPFSPLRENDR